MRGIDYVFLFLILGAYGAVVWLWITKRKDKALAKKEGDTVETVTPKIQEEKNEPDDSDDLYMGTNGFYSIEAYLMNSRLKGTGKRSQEEEYNRMIREELKNG